MLTVQSLPYCKEDHVEVSGQQSQSRSVLPASISCRQQGQLHLERDGLVAGGGGACQDAGSHG